MQKKRALLSLLAPSLFLMSCSPRIIGFVRPVGLNGFPAEPSLLALGSGVVSPSGDPVATFSIGIVSSGDTVSIYSDSACSTLLGSAVASGSSVDVTSSALPVGTTTVYAKAVSADGKESPCSSASVSYTVQAPVISFSRSQFTIQEDGTSVGPLVTVSRDIAGGDYDVTLTSDGITAESSDLTLGTVTVHFTGSATTATVPVSDFAPVVNSSVEGDKFFRVKLSSPTGGATLGAQADAQVNLLDGQITDAFFFTQALYSGTESDGTVSIQVGRAGSTASPASVQVTFLDGTAAGGVDYVAAPITVSFAAGESERTASVPITDRAGYQANRSFFAELGSPSGSNTLRPWATAKVRVLDSDDATVCDSTNDNVAVNAGFGGGDGNADPYRICSLSQLYRVRNNLTAKFRLMADLDLDPTLDADPGTVGVQPFTGMSSIFTGGFNGDEHILKNFRHTANDGANVVALFYDIGGNVSVIVEKLNLTQARVENTSSGGKVAGIVGRTTTSVNTLQDLSYSGLVRIAGAGFAGGILERFRGTAQNPMRRNFVHGWVHQNTASNSGCVGGLMDGVFDGSSAVNLSKNYSVATVTGGGTAGGLVGRIEPGQWNITLTTDLSHSKGIVSSSATSAGGLFASLSTTSGSNITLSNSFSTSPVTAYGHAGGLTAEYFCNGNPTASTCVLTDSYATGKVTTTDSGYRTGGLIGLVSIDNDITIANSHATGKIEFPEWQSGGGLIGGINGSGSNSPVMTISNTYATGDVGLSGVSNTGGGLIGYITLYTPVQVNITGSYATGNIIMKTNSYNAGGFIGSIRSQSGTSGSGVSIATSYATGTVTGFHQAGGFVGAVDLATSTGATLSMNDCYSTGTVSPGSNARDIGGFGGAMFVGNATSATVTLTNLRATGNVTGYGDVGGLFGSIRSNSGTGSSITLENSRYTTGTVSFTEQGGGLVGNVEVVATAGQTNSTLIRTSYSTGTIAAATGNSNGALIGLMGSLNSGTVTIGVERSYATSNITATLYTGGLIGRMYAGANSTISVKDSYSTGTVAGTSSVGGLVGEMSGNSGTGVLSVTNSYTRSSVSGSGGSVNGLIGNASAATVTNAYWLKDAGINVALATADGNNRTVAELQTANATTYSPTGSVPTDWDFATVWNPPSAGVYPTLR